MKPVPRVIAVAIDEQHRFSKITCTEITLIAGRGVEGDAHAGGSVQHLSRLAKTPDAPNLRQVHLIHAELFDELAEAGYSVTPGDLGENITTSGIDLLALPCGARLKFGSHCLIELTGLRNPCRQIDSNIGRGAMAAVLDREDDGTLRRKAGVMAIVLAGGIVRPGDPIDVEYSLAEGAALQPV